MAIEINADDVAQAETFLENLMTQEIPEGRLQISDGDVLDRIAAGGEEFREIGG